MCNKLKHSISRVNGGFSFFLNVHPGSQITAISNILEDCNLAPYDKK